MPADAPLGAPPWGLHPLWLLTVRPRRVRVCFTYSLLMSLQVIAPLLRVLQRMHSLQLMHRDIKVRRQHGNGRENCTADKPAD